MLFRMSGPNAGDAFGREAGDASELRWLRGLVSSRTQVKQFSLARLLRSSDAVQNWSRNAESSMLPWLRGLACPYLSAGAVSQNHCRARANLTALPTRNGEALSD